MATWDGDNDIVVVVSGRVEWIVVVFDVVVVILFPYNVPDGNPAGYARFRTNPRCRVM
jgi:hypothetical protein